MKLHLLTDKKLAAIIDRNIKASKTDYATALQTEIINKQISLASLQNQINPHFLYNALECVRGQAILDDAPVIADMVTALSSYFRYSISTKSDIVTIRDEIENVKNYLKIQQFRFNNRFAIEIVYDEDDDALDAMIPKLTLQPIVENAIQHGFEAKLGDATIRITITRTEKNVNILVSDNGIGMNHEQLERLIDKMVNYDVIRDATTKHNGLAIPNIDKRLKLFFGEEFGLHITSVEDIGTDIEIHIPYVSSEEAV